MRWRWRKRVRVEVEHHALRVLIDDLPHVWLDREKLVGFNSWVLGHPGHSWCIEYVVMGAEPLQTQYDTRALWEEVLRGLNAALSPSAGGRSP